MSQFVVARASHLVLGVMIGILLLIGGVTWEGFQAACSARDWTRRTYAAIEAIQDLSRGLHEAENSQGGFLPTAEEDTLVPYEAAVGKVATMLGKLQRSTIDSSTQQDRTRMLAPGVQRRLIEGRS